MMEWLVGWLLLRGTFIFLSLSLSFFFPSFAARGRKETLGEDGREEEEAIIEMDF